MSEPNIFDVFYQNFELAKERGLYRVILGGRLRAKMLMNTRGSQFFTFFDEREELFGFPVLYDARFEDNKAYLQNKNGDNIVVLTIYKASGEQRIFSEIFK